MKKINMIYWIATGLFAALMIFSAIPDAMNVPDAAKFMAQLGYPKYFTPFIGIMKIAGCIALLLPISPRLKEWAYAGLAFDLFGAIFSLIAAGMANAGMFLMVLWIAPGVVSYIYFHKRINAQRP